MEIGNTIITISEDEIDDLDFPDFEEEVVKNNRWYVDNVKFSKELADWSKANKLAIEQGVEPPIPNNYIGECITLICTNYGKKPSFINYSYLDEMIGDAIENVVKYLGNFDVDAPTRSGKPNGYGYVSLITHHAFTRRIEEEHRESYYKAKSFELNGGMDMFAGEDTEELRDMGIEDVGAIQADLLSKVYEYENKMKARKLIAREKVAPKISNKSSLLSFFDGED